MKKPAFEGSITKVHGIRVGQAQNREAKTGVTVILAGHDGATVGVDVRGAAPGTRETDLCQPENMVEKANAVVLSGGSAFGLASATGVMEFLGVVAGVVCILLLIALLMSLITWLGKDISSTFATLRTHFQ